MPWEKNVNKIKTEGVIINLKKNPFLKKQFKKNFKKMHIMKKYLWSNQNQKVCLSTWLIAARDGKPAETMNCCCSYKLHHENIKSAN